MARFTELRRAWQALLKSGEKLIIWQVHQIPEGPCPINSQSVGCPQLGAGEEGGAGGYGHAVSVQDTAVEVVVIG